MASHMMSTLPTGGLIARKFRKRSYRIEFIEPETFSGAREIHLNAEYKDPSLIRNKLSFRFLPRPQAFWHAKSTY